MVDRSKTNEELVAEVKAAELRLDQLRSHIRMVAQWRSDAVEALRERATTAEIAILLGRSRQAVYAALEAREPRPYLLQHQTANDNWTQTFASLGEAKAAADGVGHDPQARQEISFFDTGEGWIRAGSRMEWMYRGPIRERAISDGTSSLLGDFVS